jgi:dTDP-4-amino-4,6-dideoxygalactose transaminase
MAVHALGLGPGDDVVVTPRSFVATVAAFARTGARPVFADVDRDSQNITPESVAAALTPDTKAVVAVHLAGWPADIPGIRAITDPLDIAVIEDAAQAHGAAIDGHKVGSMGRVNAFSFCQDKIITTAGEGGMVTTDDDALWNRMWSYKDHGKSFDLVNKKDWPPGFRWQVTSLGTNGRLTEMQSAVGRIQLGKLDDMVDKRRANALRLELGLSEMPGLRIARPSEDVRHSYYRYYAFVETDRLRPGWDRDRIMQAIAAEGITCNAGSCPEIYNEAALEDVRPESRLPVARELGETSLMFLTHPTMGDLDMDDMIEAVDKVMAAATG